MDLMLCRTADLAPFPGEPQGVQHHLHIKHSLSSCRRTGPKNKLIFPVQAGLFLPPGLICLQSIVIAFPSQFRSACLAHGCFFGIGSCLPARVRSPNHPLTRPPGPASSWRLRIHPSHGALRWAKNAFEEKTSPQVNSTKPWGSGPIEPSALATLVRFGVSAHRPCRSRKTGCLAPYSSAPASEPAFSM